MTMTIRAILYLLGLVSDPLLKRQKRTGGKRLSSLESRQTERR